MNSRSVGNIHLLFFIFYSVFWFSFATRCGCFEQHRKGGYQVAELLATTLPSIPAASAAPLLSSPSSPFSTRHGQLASFPLLIVSL